MKPNSELPPAATQAVGLLLIIITTIVWVINGDFNAALLAAGGSLVGLGEYGSAISRLTKIQEKIGEYSEDQEQPPSKVRKD